VRLDQGKRRHGSNQEDEDEEEEEEEVGAYGSTLPILWEDLTDEDMSAGDDASLGGPFPFHVGRVSPWSR
jgi:hypothetical protein